MFLVGNTDYCSKTCTLTKEEIYNLQSKDKNPYRSARYIYKS